METFFSGINLLMRWDVALALFIGSVGGFGVLMGMIPGVGEFTAQFMPIPMLSAPPKHPKHSAMAPQRV